MVVSLFDAAFAVPENTGPRFNVCPTENILVAVSDGERSLRRMRWGFLPHWYKTPGDGPLLINARAETIAEKPAFRKACRERRCLVPATGFYEWIKAADGGRDPYYIQPSDRDAFAFAGVWRDWTGADGTEMSTVAIVTTSANADIEHIHHRMPVIVDPEDFALWLGEGGKGAATLMRPAPSGRLLSYRVSRDVNGTKLDEARLTEPLPAN